MVAAMAAQCNVSDVAAWVFAESNGYTVAEPRCNTAKDIEVSWTILTVGHPVLEEKQSGNGRGKEYGNK